MADIDREKVIKELELLKDFLCDGLPGKRVVFNSYIGIANDAIAMLKEQEQAMKEKDGTISNLIAQIKEISQCYERVVRCKDCDNRECDGRAGTIVCGITGESHSRLWFCADGERKEGR